MSTEENVSVKTDEMNVEQMTSSDLQEREDPVQERPEQTGSAPKKKFSILCLIGFGTWVISLCVLIVMFIVYGIKDGGVALAIGDVIAGPLVPCLIASTVALVICIIGIPVAVAKKKRGRWFGVVGAVFTLPAPICLLILWGLKSLLMAIVSILPSTPAFHYPTYMGPTIQCEDYSVNLKDRNADGLSEGVALKWYWDGDPDHTTIRPEMVNNDQTKITSIGYCASVISGPSPYVYYSFELALPTEKEYSGIKYHSVFIEDPKDHLDEYLIEPGTKVIFDEIEFHVIIHSDIQHVCIGFDGNGSPTSEDKMLNHFLVVENEDGSITFYRYYLFFECEEDNEHFYADEDGILHVKDHSDGYLAEVNRCLYKALDDFEPFELIYEGPSEQETGTAEEE
ncbi:MAG: hypothetical protein J5825_12210 [Lachnospiraceae bacterium]|nr:hypothetical protein [Lachnospiraceae bacterium]